MRKALESSFSTPVGIGGTFLHAVGTVKYHVMPDFSACPLNSDEDVENWLNFYEFKAPVVNMGMVTIFIIIFYHNRGAMFRYENLLRLRGYIWQI